MEDFSGRCFRQKIGVVLRIHLLHTAGHSHNLAENGLKKVVVSERRTAEEDSRALTVSFLMRAIVSRSPASKTCLLCAATPPRHIKAHSVFTTLTRALQS